MCMWYYVSLIMACVCAYVFIRNSVYKSSCISEIDRISSLLLGVVRAVLIYGVVVGVQSPIWTPYLTRSQATSFLPAFIATPCTLRDVILPLRGRQPPKTHVYVSRILIVHIDRIHIHVTRQYLQNATEFYCIKLEFLSERKLNLCIV